MTVLSNPNNMDSRVFNLELGTPALRVRACPYVSQDGGLCRRIYSKDILTVTPPSVVMTL